MKRLLTFIVVTALAVAAYPMCAIAAVNDTPHDYLGAGVRGRCEVCHVPHAASASTAKRLWRASKVMTADSQADDPTWDQSVTGQLCGMCHGTSAGAGWATAQNKYSVEPHDTSGTVYSADSHRRDMDRLTNTPHVAKAGCGDTAANVSVRPYMSGDRIQCTSCHNVHDDTTRPFLRADNIATPTVSEVCGDCHNRYNQQVGDDNVTIGSASMHPVDIPYVDDGGNAGTYGTNNSNGGTTQLKANLSALNGRAAAMTLGGWSLDIPGRFQNTNGTPITTGAYTPTTDGNYVVGCQTCHAIHNPVATADDSKELYLLAIGNAPVGTEGSAGAPLCETCHGGGDGSATQWVGAPVGASTLGNILDDHPIDMQPDGTPKLENWNGTTRWERYPDTSGKRQIWPYYAPGTSGGFYQPASNNANIENALGRIVCTSCHSAHNGEDVVAATDKGRLKRRGLPSGETEFCYGCHKAEDTVPSYHHSTKSIGNTDPGNWSNGGTGLSAIQCASCHGAGAEASLNAHMGFFILTDGTNAIANNNSQLCLNCHTDGGDVATDPVDYIAQDTSVTNTPNGHLNFMSGNNQTYQTHYIGTFGNGSNGINVKLGSWYASVNARGASYSKYGGGTDNHNMHAYGSAGYAMPGSPQLICESCHSVLMNAGAITGDSLGGGWKVNLLLQNYEDNEVGATTGTVDNTGDTSGGTYQQGGVGSGFCVACHNQNVNSGGMGTSAGIVSHSVVNGPKLSGTGPSIVPPNMHPMTGWTITRAVDAGATGDDRYLRTAATRYASVGPANGSATAGGSYDGTDRMSCDGCHRPHLADPNGIWSISYNPAAAPRKRSVILEGTASTAAPDNDYGPFCQICHDM